MQIGIGAIVLTILLEALWAMTPLAAPPSFKWAVRVGLALVVAGLAMGGVMITAGVLQDLDNPEPGQVESPVTFGEAGLVVFPHLLSLHGLFVFSVLAWLLSFTSWPERRRTGVVQTAMTAYVALIVVSLVQALDGRAPFDLSGLLAVLFWISLAFVIGVSLLSLVVGLGSVARQPSE